MYANAPAVEECQMRRGKAVRPVAELRLRSHPSVQPSVRLGGWGASATSRHVPTALPCPTDYIDPFDTGSSVRAVHFCLPAPGCYLPVETPRAAQPGSARHGHLVCIKSRVRDCQCACQCNVRLVSRVLAHVALTSDTHCA